MAKWTLDLNEYAKKMNVKIKDVRTSYAFHLFSSIVKKTPVDTGRARGNWTIKPGTPDTAVYDNTVPKYRSLDDVPKPDGDEPIFISNNLPYIEKLEYGTYPNPPKKQTGKTINGFSCKAPEGMIGVTLANNENIFKTSVEYVKNDRI